MKKTGRVLLSLFAAVAIMTSMLVVPVSAAPTTVLLSNDYEDKTTGASIVSQWTVGEADGNKYAQNSGWNAYYQSLSQTVITGRIRASFDYMANTTGSSSHVDLMDNSKGFTDNEFLTLLQFYGGNIVCAGTVVAPITANTWYSVDVIVDMDTKHITSKITEKSSGTVIGGIDKTLTASSTGYSGWPNTATSFDRLVTAGGSGRFIDNILIQTIPDLYTTTTWFSQDFEGEVSIGNAEVRTDTDGNKYEVSTSSWGVVHLCENRANPLSTGIIRVSVDVKAPNGSSGNGGYAFLYNTAKYGWNVDNEYLTVAHVTDNTVRFAGHGLGAIDANVWYTVESIIDLDTHKCIAVAYNKATGEAIGQYSGVLPTTDTAQTDWPADGAASFTRITTRGANGVVYFDNITIEKFNSEYRYSNEYQNGAAPSNGAVAVDGLNQYLRTTTSWQPVMYNFNSVSSDKIRVAFDFKNDATNNNANVSLGNSSSMSSENEILTFLYLNSNGYYQAYSSDGTTRRLGARIAGTWLNCEAIVDLDSKKVTTTLRYKAGGALIGTQTATLPRSSANFTDWPNTVSAFDTLRFVGSGANAIYVDDIIVEKIITAPVAEAENIKVYDYFNELQNNWTAVSPASMTYTVDFETNMDSSTVTASNIYVKAAGAGAPVSGTVTYSNHIATLTLSSALAPNTTYTLHIDGDVANTAGVTLGTDKEYTIITTDGTTSADMGTPTIGGSAAGNFSTITAGQTITVPVNYVNTTGEAKTLHFICAYYGAEEGNRERFKWFEYQTTPVASSVIGNNYNFTHTFQNVDGAVSLKFMIWDGFDTVLSLSTPVSIKN